MTEEQIVEWMELIHGPFVRISPTQIDCILSHPKAGEIPFTADQNDPEEHGRVIYQGIIDGGYSIEVSPNGGEGGN